MRPIIREMMNGICIEALRKLSNKNSIVRREIKKHGGLVAFAKREAKTIIDIYYDLSFGTAGRAGKSYADPFVVCFCSHSDEPEYVKENGLLSQWRGYGAEGGVAIIFDMEQLCQTMLAELKNFKYSAIYLKPVVYHESELPGDDDFEKLEQALRQLFKLVANGENYKEVIFDVFTPFFGLVTRFKHQGFKEECEIRLSMSPVPKFVEDTENSKPTFSHGNWLGNQTLRVALNEVPNKKELPIQRIIVGPQHDQSTVMQRVIDIIGKRNITVTKSETPYIPMWPSPK